MPVAVDRATATFVLRPDRRAARLCVVVLTPRLQVKKPHWEVARDALRASGDSQQLPVLPVVEGRGGSVKRIQGGKEKEIVRFR